MAVTLLAEGVGFDLTHIPYKGGGPLMNDAIAGHVPRSIGSEFVTKPHLDSKRLRPLAVTTRTRSANLPEVPSVAESGFAGFSARVVVDKQLDTAAKVVKGNDIKADRASSLHDRQTAGRRRPARMHTEDGGCDIDHRLRRLDPGRVV